MTHHGITVSGPDARKIAAGRKTTIIRPARGDNPPRLMVGEIYPVTITDATRPLCDVEVLGRELTTAGTIGFDDARADGHRTTNEWRIEWVRRHDRAWVQGLEAQRGDILTDEEHLERFADRHAGRNVWIVRLRLGDVPRLLAPVSGYVAKGGLPGEPEAVSEDVQEQITRDRARVREQERAGEISRRDLRSTTAKLRRAEREADAKGVDITPELAELRRVVAKIERRLTDAA